MQKDERDLVEVLKSELEFLIHGEYGRSPKSPWRPQYIFEDSFTCLNCNSRENPRPCSDCVLMQLVPGDRRSEKIPCRYIPFNKSGETLDSLYRSCDQEEIEETVGKWLEATIRQLEEGRQAVGENHNKQAGPGDVPPSGTALYQEPSRSDDVGGTANL